MVRVVCVSDHSNHDVNSHFEPLERVNDGILYVTIVEVAEVK